MINAVLRCLRKWQWYKRRETVKFPVGNYMQANSCFMQWPWTFGVSLWWKMKRLTPALHYKVWGCNTHTPRITAKNQDYAGLFLNHNGLAILLPKLAEASLNTGQKITFFQANTVQWLHTEARDNQNFFLITLNLFWRMTQAGDWGFPLKKIWRP